MASVGDIRTTTRARHTVVLGTLTLLVLLSGRQTRFEMLAVSGLMTLTATSALVLVERRRGQRLRLTWLIPAGLLLGSLLVLTSAIVIVTRDWLT